MRVPPRHVRDADVLRAVRRHWDSRAAAAEYLPVGFGAHHWRIRTPDGAGYFATVDLPTAVRPPAYFRRAYAGAAELVARGTPGVVAPLASHGGEHTAALGEALLTVTAWLAGHTPSASEARRPEHLARTVRLLTALHAAPVPGGLTRWSPRVAPGAAARLRAATATPWTRGPLGEQARALLLAADANIPAWEREHAELTSYALARNDSWVVTHGEPHHANQLLHPGGLAFVDWESLAVAPAERDLTDLPPATRRRLGADEELVRLFGLEWRLSEIEEYQERFSLPHEGNEDDLTALAGLRGELAD